MKMRAIVWMWKHRHHWCDFKEIFDNRIELLRLIRNVSFIRFSNKIDEAEIRELADRAHGTDSWLRYCLTSMVRPPRPWPAPPDAPPFKQEEANETD